MSRKFRLLPAAKYVEELIDSIDNSKYRIDIIALTVAEDSQTKQLIDAVCRASERGVAVRMGFDLYFTYRETEKTSERWWSLWNRAQLMRETKRRLKKSGAKVQWLGQSGLLMFFRRTHTKWSVIDDTVYSFGGVNLHSGGIANIDYMFRVDDIELADKLHYEHSRILAMDKSGQGYKSHLFGTVSHTILVDGGKSRDSIIYRHLLSYAQEAEHIVFVSQHCPTGRLAKILRQHNNSELYFNDWRNANDIFNRLLIRWSMYIHRLSTCYRQPTYLHAKFMIFTMPNGKQVAITGSHNFVEGGVWLGTREVALETTDKHIINQLKDFLDSSIKI